jgi:signal transduction histidine kinase
MKRLHREGESIVEALGGRLHIESPVGRGTQASAEIPCQTRLNR